MHSSRLWPLFFVGSAAATAALIFFLDLTPSGRDQRPLTAAARAGGEPGPGAGLIVHLSGGDGAASEALDRSLDRTKAKRIFALVESRTNVFATVEAALERHDIDRRRVFLMSGSAPLAVVREALESTNVFAAAHIWIAGNDAPDELARAIFPPHVGIVADGPGAALAAKRVAALALEQSCHVVYRELESRASSELRREQREKDFIDDAVVWFTTLRNEAVPPEKEAVEELRRAVAGRWARLAKEDFDRMARIGGPIAGELILRALGSENDKYRIAASARCKGTWFGDEVFCRLGPLLRDSNEIVRLQVIDSFALLARWHNADAQEALCRAALDTDMTEKDRARVIRALAESVRLDVPHGIAVKLGAGAGASVLNPGGVWALKTFVGLLGSESAALRRAAESAVWMWKQGDAGAGDGMAEAKRFPAELYDALTGDTAERRKAIAELRNWSAAAYR